MNHIMFYHKQICADKTRDTGYFFKAYLLISDKLSIFVVEIHFQNECGAKTFNSETPRQNTCQIWCTFTYTPIIMFSHKLSLFCFEINVQEFIPFKRHQVKSKSVQKYRTGWLCGGSIRVNTILYMWQSHDKQPSMVIIGFDYHLILTIYMCIECQATINV